MVRKLLFFVAFVCSITFNGQQLKTEFAKASDTISSDSQKEISVTFNVHVPKQSSFEGTKVYWSIIPTDVSLKDSEIFLPSNREIIVSKTSDFFKPFTIKIQRSNTLDRIIKIKLSAKKDNADVPIESDLLTEYIIYIKPIAEGEVKALQKKKDYELWLLTGTNLDLIDGIKAEDLYFKANYLANIKSGSKSTRSWINVDFGRNRYFNSIDSLGGISFVQRLPSVSPDTIRQVVGEYKTVKKVETNNTFVDIYYMYQIRKLSSETSKLFFTLGLSLNSQTVKTTYNNSITATDTISFAVGQQVPRQTFPMYRNSSLKQNYKGIGYGIVYVLDEEKINVKTSLIAGWNTFTYPIYIRYNGDAVVEEHYKSDPKAFMRFRFEGTVLNPGLSLGFETFLRAGENPIYNVTLTKTIEFEQLASLFGPLPTATKSK
ncbi:hypothetical protein D0817_24290 [Flavobacterium cupreum]|uniref:Uncharacterized protein n=1 Tax=Flavobacterium cupreum TaxID=2133766 RepID=A0A434A0E7_9FLAO|nr:hypothetical protein [Flavobacterium cupreum]RUT67860.1 hypothetical protein D0817_24290 [Flavobacterium cupreum]